MKKLCIADTCSLIYLSNTDVRIANKLIYNWLWDEFRVSYSNAVFDEITRHRSKIIGKQNYNTHVWKGNFNSCEKKLFGDGLTRIIEQGVCPHCYETVNRSQPFEANLDDSKDRGERHNCCVAISALRDYSQVIYLTDDHRAIRDYVSQLFNTIPLGVVWSSLDFVVYLFSKYRNRISLNETIEALRSINAQDGAIEPYKSASRLTKYITKTHKIDKLLS